MIQYNDTDCLNDELMCKVSWVKDVLHNMAHASGTFVVI